MGEVIDFHSGEPVKIGRIPKRKSTQNLIESLYQRRHQIDDIIVIYNDKVCGTQGFGISCQDDINRRILHSFFNDYMASFADLDEE